jgi:formylglycine-generating enzyme required for sulfatase activity
MQDERDYYTILGVAANAPEAEIRRAFRARAKELHPDSKPASEREQAHREFNLLTEAYDALKDAERREAYDEELRSSRQLTRVERKGRPPGAFAMGLAFGLLLAGAALGAKFFLDRSARAPKNQDSLRITRVQQPPAVAAPSPAESGTGAAPAAAGSPRLAAAPEPAETRAAEDRTRVAAKEAEPAETAPPPAAHAADSGIPAMDQSRQPSAQHSEFVGAVLLLESQTSSDAGGVAVYRLVSLVNSSTAIDELSEAASLAGRPETVELIRGRIAALKEEQGKQAASSAKPQELAVQQSAPAASPPVRQDGTYDIATGARATETILRLHPGNGLKESFSDCAACPEMVTVPGGQTVIGARPESHGYRPEEGPAHKIAIQKPFAVSKHGISAENWRACVDAGICRPTLASYLTAGPGIPATRVSWFDAKTYVEWLSKSTGRRYRLLSEAEWEYTAQAGKASDAAAKLDTQAAGRGAVPGVLHLGGAGLKQLGETKPNGWGVYPLPGNLLEWVEDCWHGSYAQAPQDGSPWLSGSGGDCAYRVVRGVAAAGGDFGGKRLAGRARESADARSPALGFRIARDLNALSKTALDASGTAGSKAARGD